MKIRVNEISFGSSILHKSYSPYILQGVIINVSKTGNSKSFSKAWFSPAHKLPKLQKFYHAQFPMPSGNVQWHKSGLRINVVNHVRHMA